MEGAEVYQNRLWTRWWRASSSLGKRGAPSELEAPPLSTIERGRLITFFLRIQQSRIFGRLEGETAIRQVFVDLRVGEFDLVRVAVGVEDRGLLNLEGLRVELEYQARVFGSRHLRDQVEHRLLGGRLIREADVELFDQVSLTHQEFQARGQLAVGQAFFERLFELVFVDPEARAVADQDLGAAFAAGVIIIPAYLSGLFEIDPALARLGRSGGDIGVGLLKIRVIIGGFFVETLNALGDVIGRHLGGARAFGGLGFFGCLLLGQGVGAAAQLEDAVGRGLHAERDAAGEPDDGGGGRIDSLSYFVASL